MRYVLFTIFFATSTAADDQRPSFQACSKSQGVEFVHVSPVTPKRHTHLTMGSGLAWLDIDNDGWPDLYCGQGGTFDESKPLQTNTNTPADMLFRNSGSGFRSNTACGIDNTQYTMGVTVADYDNDGFDDLFVSCFGPDSLYINQGDGTFVRNVMRAESQDAQYSASTSWLDADNDGNIDLYVANYLKLDPANYQVCTTNFEGKTFYISCHPRKVKPVADRFFLNKGNGSLEDQSQNAGLADAEPMQALGVVAADLDRDGDTDVYVANDSVANYLWNNQDGQFSEEGLLSGTALNRLAAREAGMGVACGDVDGNGLLDLFVTNFQSETNTLYRNEGGMLFFDVTDELGLAESGRNRLGFGTSLVDAENDGWPDLFVANGHIHDQLKALGRAPDYRQKALLMSNRKGERFLNVTATAGDYFSTPNLGRGSCVADFNHDGLMDVAVSHLNGSTELLQNQTESVGHFIKFKLVGTTSNRAGIGAILDIQTSARTITVPRLAATSYLSADSAILHVGLGEATLVNATVSWPGGKKETFSNLQIDQLNTLIEGRGTSSP